jgi:hypothetical protein
MSGAEGTLPGHRRANKVSVAASYAERTCAPREATVCPTRGDAELLRVEADSANHSTALTQSRAEHLSS